MIFFLALWLFLLPFACGALQTVHDWCCSWIRRWRKSHARHSLCSFRKHPVADTGVLVSIQNVTWGSLSLRLYSMLMLPLCAHKATFCRQENGHSEDSAMGNLSQLLAQQFVVCLQSWQHAQRYGHLAPHLVTCDCLRKEWQVYPTFWCLNTYSLQGFPLLTKNNHADVQIVLQVQSSTNL